jgi:DNA-binding ferritin-like protein
MLFLFEVSMDKINNLICSLIALQNFCKDIHYNAKGDAFYSKHLLADRIQNNISDYIDSIKEVCVLGNDEETLPSGEYLSRATSLIPELESNDKKNFESLQNLIVNILTLIQSIEPSTKGEDNLYGAIAEDLQNSLGLLNRQIKG